MRHIKTLVIILIALNFTFANDDAKGILKKVHKKYEALKDATVEFSQNMVFAVSKMEQNFAGTLKMKKGNKYRIELEHQTIVTDGYTVWSYYHTTNQIIIDKYKEDPKSFSPDKVLVNVPQNYNTFMLGYESLFDKKTAVIKLTPKDDRSFTKSLKVWIDMKEYLMRKIEIVDISDNISTYTISSIKLNTGISDNVFKYEVPKGVETVDLR